MTGNSDRLSRIEAILETLAQRSVEADQRLTRIEQAIDETRKIADSNARAIQAWSLTIESDRIDREEADSELRIDINAVQQSLSQTAELHQTLLNVQLRDRDEWRQQRAEVSQQIQALIDNQNQDRLTWHEQRELLSATVQESQKQIQALVGSQNSDRQESRQQRAEINQQIQALVDNQNQDRQESRQRSAHLDQQIQSLIDLSRENIQAHAAFRSEIQRISNRVAG